MWNILVSPIDNRAVRKISKAVSHYFKEKDVAFAVYFCGEAGELERVSNELSLKGEHDYILIGDNDALNQFVNGVVDLSDVCVAVVSSGKNNFAKMLKQSKHIKAYLDHILLKQRMQIDLIKCNDRIAVNYVSCGLDVPAVENYESHKVKSDFNRTRAIYRSLFSFGQMQANVTIDGEHKNAKPFLMLSFCNGKYIAGHIKINPHSNLNDGLANLIIIPPMTNFKRFMLLQKMKSGKHIYNPVVEEYWASVVTLQNEQIFKMNIDGTIHEMKNPKLIVLPGALNVYLGENKLGNEE